MMRSHDMSNSSGEFVITVPPVTSAAADITDHRDVRQPVHAHSLRLRHALYISRLAWFFG